MSHSSHQSPHDSPRISPPNATNFGSLSLDGFLDALAAKQPTPGGGAAAGVCGALGAALARMVVSYSLGKKSLAEHQGLLTDTASLLDNARALMVRLAQEDAAAYGLVNELSKLPEHDPRRMQGWDLATRASVQVPLAIAACAVETLRVLASLCGTSNTHLRSDLAVAAVLAEATARSAWWNAAVNLASVRDGAERVVLAAQADQLVADARARAARVEELCRP